MARLPILVLFLAIAQQSAQTRPLPSWDRELDHDFTQLTSIRELRDGSVLLVDARERLAWHADFTTQRVTLLGRQGRGPGEYEYPYRLVALPDDSTLLLDQRARRWLLLRGASVVGESSPDQLALRAGGFAAIGALGSRHLVALIEINQGPSLPSESFVEVQPVALLRIDRMTGAVDTMVRMRGEPTRVTVRGSLRQPLSIRFDRNPLAVGDQAAVFPDGVVAVARADEYRLEWLFPDGRSVNVPALPFPRRAVTQQYKALAAREQERRTGRELGDVSSFSDWPDHLPPFLPNALVPAPDGRLWIRRAPERAEEATYDIIDRSGRIVRHVLVSSSEYVVGFGSSAVYTVSVSPDGLQRLRRHPLRR